MSPARRHERLTSRRRGGEPQGERQPDARQRARQLVHARHEPWRGVQHAAELQQQVRVFGRPALAAARNLAANPNPSPNPNHSCGSIVGELPGARQAKGPTWAKPGMRQDTPNLDDGILTNGNVLLEASRASPGPSPNPTTLQPEP